MPIDQSLIDDLNEGHAGALADDYEALRAQLARRGINIDAITRAVGKFAIALPSWGLGTGGTRFARYPGPGQPANIFDKLDDCGVIQQLLRATPTVSLHIPWDKSDDLKALKQKAKSVGLGFDAINSNTFQDFTGPEALLQVRQPQPHRRCGTAAGDRAQHRVHRDRPGTWLEGAVSLDRRRLELPRPVELHQGLRALHRLDEEDRQGAAEGLAHLPQYKLYEPAFYSTVLADWGSSYLAAVEVGPQAQCLVDLGHHPHGTNIEMIVARLIQFGRLAGFHVNDSKYGDDDLDTGSINPYQLFLVFNELVDAAARKAKGFKPAYMLDQSHNVTDPIESLITSTVSVLRAYCQALLVERDRLESYQADNDALMAEQTLKRAFVTDVGPILAKARLDAGGAIDPIGAYRASKYRAKVAKERPAVKGGGGGIV